MHEKEILQNLARSGRLASQTHRRALTHSLLNKALRCILIQDSNVSSNPDCQPPTDASTARYDRFRQQSHFCWNCRSKDGMSKFQNHDEHHAIKQDLQEKLHQRCTYCQHRDDLPGVGSKTGQDGKRDQQQPVIRKLCQRCLVAGNDDQDFHGDSDLEDAASDDICQECGKRVTSLPRERAPGRVYMRETSDYPHDNSNGCPHCETQQGQQSVRSGAFQPVREINMNMKVSRDDKPCSCGEKGVASLRRQLHNEWYQRNSENQGSSDCQPSRKCSCSQYLQQRSPDEASERGKTQEHKRNYQRISGNDGQLRQSSFNMEMHRIADLWPTMGDHRYMRGSDSQIYKGSNEDQQYKGSKDRLYKRSGEDQKYKKSEDRLYKKSDDQHYKNSEDQQYKGYEDQLYKRSEDPQYNKSEDRLYKRFQDPQYKDPENQKYKETNGDQHKKGMNDPLNKKPNDHPQYKRTGDQPYQKNVEDRVYMKQNNDLVNEKISDSQQYKRIDNPTNSSDELQSTSTGSSQHYRKAADDIPQQPKADQQSKSSWDELQEEHISQVQQSEPGLDAQYQKIRDLLHNSTADQQQHKRPFFQKFLSPIGEESFGKSYDNGQGKSSSGGKNSRTSNVQEFGRNTFERTTDGQRYMRISDNLFVRTGGDPQSERISRDQQDMRTSNNQFVRTSGGNPQFGRVSQDQRYARTSDIQQPEKVCCDQQYMRTSDYPFVRTSDNQQFEETSYKQQCVRTNGNQQFTRSCDDQLRSSDNLYVRPSESQRRRTSENQETTRARDVWQGENNAGDQQLESEEEYLGYTDSRQCKICSDNQQYTSSSRNQQSTSHRGNKTSCNTCKCKNTDGQRSRRQMGGILIQGHAQWSKMEDTQQQEKQNFDAAMKQMSLYMNGISQVCECFYDSCSKDNLSLLERRHIRMFHKGVLPVRQQAQTKSDTASPEDVSSFPSRCPCLGSVNRHREDKPLSEERPRSQSRIPSTDRSQNFMGFSNTGPCLEPVLEDNSQMEDVLHRANKSQSAKSQTTGKSQLCVRFSDTDAEINQSNKNVHCSEMSSSLPSDHLLKHFHSSFPSHEDRKEIHSTESASDNTLNSQSDETVLPNCIPLFDSRQADCKAGSFQHLTHVHKSGHKMATTTRNKCLPQQTLKTISGARPPQDVFIEGVSAFPTKVSKSVSKSSKSKVRSSRSNLEQGILIRTKPGSYIVKKPKEDSSIHLLQVNPGNYVKLNM